MTCSFKESVAKAKGGHMISSRLTLLIGCLLGWLGLSVGARGSRLLGSCSVAALTVLRLSLSIGCLGFLLLILSAFGHF